MIYDVRRAYFAHAGSFLKIFDTQTHLPLSLEGVTIPEAFGRLVKYCTAHRLYDNPDDKHHYLEIGAEFDLTSPTRIAAWGPSIHLHDGEKCLSWTLVDPSNGEERTLEIRPCLEHDGYHLYTIHPRHEVVCALDPAAFRIAIQENLDKTKLSATCYDIDNQIHIDIHHFIFHN